METQFKYLSIGTRFSYIGFFDTTMVKISDNEFILWKESIVCFDKTVVLPLSDVNMLVVIRERDPYGTYHEYPKTAFQEGYLAYMKHPRSCNNPYVEGTKEYADWDDGWSESDWDDCE